MWRMRKNTTNVIDVPFFVDTRRINIIETKISYSNVIPYARTNGEGKLVNV
jgi:cephalosporin-C deacetylase-like acetyl esterase